MSHSLALCPERHQAELETTEADGGSVSVVPGGIVLLASVSKWDGNGMCQDAPFNTAGQQDSKIGGNKMGVSRLTS